MGVYRRLSFWAGFALIGIAATGLLAGPRIAAAPLLGPEGGGYAQGVGAAFIADTSGAYTYLCTTPGHAERGMYGSFIVRGG